MVGEIVGGIIAHSISIQTDAAHMASDIIAFFFSIMAIYISGKKASKRMTFGYYRSEVIGALASILVIWTLTGILVYLAILRVISQDFEINSIAMVVTASCGVLFNIIMYFVLHTNRCFQGVELKHHGHSHSGDGHGHDHGHSHRQKKKPKAVTTTSNDHSHGSSLPHSTPNGLNINSSENHSLPITDSDFALSPSSSNNVTTVADDCATNVEQSMEISDESNINLRAAAIHVIGDFIQSVGVLIAALIIHFLGDDYKLADPICTFIFSVLVMATTIPIVKDIFFVLMEATPAGLKYDLVLETLKTIQGVKQVHNLNMWCLTMEKFALSVHLVLEKNADNRKILREANELIRKQFKIEKVTIQIEYYDESMKDCVKCELPLK
jgi:zinc transporter 2